MGWWMAVAANGRVLCPMGGGGTALARHSACLEKLSTLASDGLMREPQRCFKGHKFPLYLLGGRPVFHKGRIC
jgi:hypothetical protein